MYRFFRYINSYAYPTITILLSRILWCFCCHKTQIRTQLKQAAVTHCDETGLCVEATLNWLHVVSTEQAIECLLMLKAVYDLPYRQVTGLAQSIMALLGVSIEIPDYTLLCKRATDLKIDLVVSPSDEAYHIVMDSTGLKVYGEGEWKVRQYGYSKRRTWRKLHLSVNATTHEIQAG